MKKILTIAGLLSVSVLTSQAAIVWTGTTSADPFDDLNWDFSGSAVTAVDSNVSVLDDITVTNGTITIPNLAGQVRLQLGNGFTMTLDNSTINLVGGGNDGVGGEPGSTGVTVEVTNGSMLNPFFITNNVTANFDATSSANFGGGGTPINVSTVNLVTGAGLTLASVAEFNEQGQKIFVNGTQYDTNGSTAGGADDTLWDNLSASRIAVPEPSGVAFLGLAGITLLFRRRK